MNISFILTWWCRLNCVASQVNTDFYTDFQYISKYHDLLYIRDQLG